MAKIEPPMRYSNQPICYTGPDTSEYIQILADKVLIFMNKLFNGLWDTKEVKCTLIISFALILSVALYCFCTRYQMIATSERDNYYVYMYDRLTGKTWKALDALPISYYLPVVTVSEEKARELQENKANAGK
jgi:hypothetical protein